MDPTDRATQAHRDALAWYIRLDTTHISNERLYAFFDWRRDPINRRAYEALEDETKARAAKIV